MQNMYLAEDREAEKSFICCLLTFGTLGILCWEIVVKKGSNCIAFLLAHIPAFPDIYPPGILKYVKSAKAYT